MKRFWIQCAAIAVLVCGGWYLLNHRQIRNWNDAVQLAESQWRRLGGQIVSPPAFNPPALRIASFNVQTFSNAKTRNEDVLQCLVHIVREFDVVAIQELRGEDTANLQSFVDAVNADRRNYALVASDPIGRGRHFERYAFLFDKDRLILDGSHAYMVGDPDDVLRREPLVGWFRAAGVEANRAFTFSLVNVHLDSRQPQREVEYLADLFRAIRGDGRGEDDVILAGDFNVDAQRMMKLRERSGLACLITEGATNVRHTRQFDNLLVDPIASSEFSGRSGVYDFLKVFNLTVDQAIAISDHLPVWAEFSAVEGFPGNLTATREPRNVR
jgi:endonuclease/exonuclease/phosphatase family metal-dependent hydrolase